MTSIVEKLQKIKTKLERGAGLTNDEIELLFQPPRVLVDFSNCLINDVDSDRPVNVIVIDKDTEGGSEENIVEVNDNEIYVNQFDITENLVEEDFVHDYFTQIERQYK